MRRLRLCEKVLAGGRSRSKGSPRSGAIGLAGSGQIFGADLRWGGSEYAGRDNFHCELYAAAATALTMLARVEESLLSWDRLTAEAQRARARCKDELRVP